MERFKKTILEFREVDLQKKFKDVQKAKKITYNQEGDKVWYNMMMEIYGLVQLW